jgi:hypothetical protein
MMAMDMEALPKPAALPRAQALGKASKVLGKAFTERSSRQSALGKNPIGKGFFAESRLSGTRQSPTLGKARNKKMQKNLKKKFNRGRGPLASARPSPSKSRHFSRLRGRRDSNS